VFDLQDRITQSVVAFVAPTVEVAEIERTRRKPAGNPDAYDCYLRGLARSNVMAEDANAEALRQFLRAIALDPDSAVAHAMAARCYTVRKQQGWDSDRRSDRAEARRLALRASELGQDDALALCHAGFALFYVCNEDYIGAAMVDEALSLNQNLAAAWSVKAAIDLFAGRHEAVIDELGRVQRLNPTDPAGYIRESTMAQAFLLLGRYDEAAIWANKSLARQPNWLLAMRSLAMARALSGDVDGARKVMARLRELHPALRISNYLDYLPYRRREDIERQNAALRLAGLPE
jgi:tetratricopeptide (TPR) repeat protein